MLIPVIYDLRFTIYDLGLVGSGYCLLLTGNCLLFTAHFPYRRESRIFKPRGRNVINGSIPTS